MLVTGFAFGLIGLELSSVLAATGPEWPRLLAGAGIVIAVVVGLRLVWLMVSTLIVRGMFHSSTTDEPHTWRETLVTWWAGMRGVATVALALAVPLTTDSGAQFPGRSEILFTAFAVVLFTLLLQGTTLPAVVRFSHVQADTEIERALERGLWVRILRAELTRLDELVDTEKLPPAVSQRLREGFERRLATADPATAGDVKDADKPLRFSREIRAISNEVLEAGRAEAMAARREPGMPPDLVDRMMRRLDLRPPPFL
jgi:CPA1 family monovalent cation:H+ antiporter